MDDCEPESGRPEKLIHRVAEHGLDVSTDEGHPPRATARFPPVLPYNARNVVDDGVHALALGLQIVIRVLHGVVKPSALNHQCELAGEDFEDPRLLARNLSPVARGEPEDAEGRLTRADRSDNDGAESLILERSIALDRLEVFNADRLPGREGPVPNGWMSVTRRVKTPA